MKNYVVRFVNDNYKGIIVLGLCLLIGLTLGLISFSFFNEQLKLEFVNNVKSTFQLAKSDGFEGINILKNAMLINLLMVLLFVFIAITIIAPIIYSGLFFLKGFSLGIYMSIILNIFGFGKGILSILLLIILPNLIYLPVFIYVGIQFINTHYIIIGTEQKSKIGAIISLGISMLIAFSIFLISILLEQNLIPVAINMYVAS